MSIVAIWPRSTASLNLSMAVRISRRARRNSTSRCRCIVTLVRGMIAEARMPRMADTTSSSTKLYPAGLKTRLYCGPWPPALTLFAI